MSRGRGRLLVRCGRSCLFCTSAASALGSVAMTGRLGRSRGGGAWAGLCVLWHRPFLVVGGCV